MGEVAGPGVGLALLCAALELDKADTFDEARETPDVDFLRGNVWATGLNVTAADRATTALKSLLEAAGSGAEVWRLAGLGGLAVEV